MSAGLPPLTEWLAAETRIATAAMLGAISATHLRFDRPGFGQRVIPRPGSVLASPVAAHYDPDPDYFFHWFRDSAIVVDALRVALAKGYAGLEAVSRFQEFVRFSLSLRELDGKEFLLRHAELRTRVKPDFLQYLRPDAEIAALSGEAVVADTRVNADGTLDFIRWARPQGDGPALRSLTVLRWWQQLPPEEEDLRSAMSELIRGDLAFTLAHGDGPFHDIWEEESGYHYYTQLLRAEALGSGAGWLEHTVAQAEARPYGVAADETLARLDKLWDAASGFYRSRTGVAAGDAAKELDSAVILGILHAGRTGGRHSVLDPKAQATLSALEELFEAEYPINHNRQPGRGVALGRYANDRYYSGGAYYFATLAAAEFYFRLATALRGGAQLAVTPENLRFRQRLGIGDAAADGRALARLAQEHGDAIMRTVQVFTPASGDLSEQFDRTTGKQTSAKRLTWSYAAFITAAASRGEACRAR
jgi:glucoamylase